MNPFTLKITDCFSHAILHIDGDAFFASCEQARNPALRGKPVITGKERGIASSMSYEAKARGITRAMPIWEIKKLCPDAIVLPSDYETYSLLSRRLYAIVRRYTADVEEYGIDECFADITGYNKQRRQSYAQIASHLQETLKKELGFTFSIGLAPNKVLAKIGSKWKKPYGFTAIKTSEIHRYLEKLPVEKIWGIGAQTTAHLAKFGIQTALQFARAKEDWVKLSLSRPFHDIWQELNGVSVMPLFLEEKTAYGSIQKFKTFTPPSRDPNFIFAQLSKNIENACIKLRRHNLTAPSAIFILRTQAFEHATIEVNFFRPTNLPPEIMAPAKLAFDKLFHRNTLYRATGFVTFGLAPPSLQRDLFNSSAKTEKLQKIYASADKVAGKFGKHALFLGASWQAHQSSAHLSERGDIPQRHDELFLGETKRKRLNIPMMMAEGI